MFSFTRLRARQHARGQSLVELALVAPIRLVPNGTRVSGGGVQPDEGLGVPCGITVSHDYFAQ